MNPRCHPDLSLILRITARPVTAYSPSAAKLRSHVPACITAASHPSQLSWRYHAVLFPSKPVRSLYPISAKVVKEKVTRISRSAKEKSGSAPLLNEHSPRMPMRSYFHPLVKAGWCPAACICRPLASKTGAWHSRNLDPGSIFEMSGNKRYAVEHPRSFIRESLYATLRKMSSTFFNSSRKKNGSSPHSLPLPGAEIPSHCAGTYPLSPGFPAGCRHSPDSTGR